MSCSPPRYICLLLLLVSGFPQSSEESLMYITKVFKNMLAYFSLCYIQHSGCWLEGLNQVADRKVKRWSDPDLPALSGATTSLLGTTRCPRSCQWHNAAGWPTPAMQGSPSHLSWQDDNYGMKKREKRAISKHNHMLSSTALETTAPLSECGTYSLGCSWDGKVWTHY